MPLSAALWEWEQTKGRLPTDEDLDAPEELKQAAFGLLDSWGVTTASLPPHSVEDLTSCVLFLHSVLSEIDTDT